MANSANDRRIDYIEMNVGSIERSKAFYGQAFGWTFLPDIQRRVESAGGRIVKPIFDFPGSQRFHFLDPDGYELAVWSKR